MDGTLWIFDGHEDIAFNTLHCTGKNFFTENTLKGLSLLPKPQLNQSDYVRLRKSGVKVIQGVIFPYRFGEDGVLTSSPDIGREETNRQLDFYLALEKQEPTKVRILRSRADLTDVLENSELLGVLLLIEDAIGISPELTNLSELYQKGVRAIGPVWNKDTHFGGGTDTDAGLTEAGKKLLAGMEQLGIALDTAHMNPTDFKDALENFHGIIINSHTCARALTEHRRNLSDEQLQALAARGAVAGVAFVPSFLNIDEKAATIDDVKQHLDHMVKVMGIEHVALGSDFDGMSYPKCARGLEDASHLGAFVEMLRHTYSSEEIEKIAYKNWLRMLEKLLK
jgi:membrane dipeptidase